MEGGWSTHSGDGSSGETRTLTDPESIKQALDEVFDQAIVFHGFTAYMRDYEVIIYPAAGVRTGVEPEHLRYLFTHCVRATVTTAVRRDVWPRSLDERLLDYEQFRADEDLIGFVWAVNHQDLYPGAELRAPSADTAQWSQDVGLPFFEALLQTNAHNIELAFSTLRVSTLQPGYTPFVIRGDGTYSKVSPS
jgi:hypothetical protein